MKIRLKYMFWNYRLIVMEQRPNWKIHVKLVTPTLYDEYITMMHMIEMGG